MCYDEPFDAPMVRRAIRAYFGLVSFLDDNIGKILGALDAAGLGENTRIMYGSRSRRQSGHARACGASRRCTRSRPEFRSWWPDPDPARANVSDAPVSLVDAYPTFLQAVGPAGERKHAGYPGHSLVEIATDTFRAAPCFPNIMRPPRQPARS
jgi:choline-sulfatase